MTSREQPRAGRPFRGLERGSGGDESSKATSKGAAGKELEPGITLFSFGYKGNAFGSFGDKRTNEFFSGKFGP